MEAFPFDSQRGMIVIRGKEDTSLNPGGLQADLGEWGVGNRFDLKHASMVIPCPSY